MTPDDSEARRSATGGPDPDSGTLTASDGGLPVVGPDSLDVSEGEDPRIVCILLAAGQGSRFGEDNKLLAMLEGEPLVRHAARTPLAAGLPVVAVLGRDARRVRDALVPVEGSVAVVGNPRYREGQSTSVRAGLRAVREVDAAVFALGDMPRVDPDSVRALVRAYRAGAGDALATAHEGRRGNPTLFDARHFGALADVTGDVGGRRILLEGERSALVETGDPGVLADVDTPADLRDV